MRTRSKASKTPRPEPPQPPPSKPTTNGGDKAESEGKKRRRLEWWRRERCIRCSEGGKGLLVCEERECAIAAHAGCLRSANSLDDSGRFFCPFCWYRRQFAHVVQLREEAEVAARNVHLFLEFKQPQNPPPPDPATEEVEEEVEKGEEEEEEEKEDGGTGSSPSKARESSTKREGIVLVGNDKRKRLHWTSAEEDMLKEGVHKFSTSANKNLPWRKVLEFGRHVFHPTRTPIDLKDKWRNIDTE